MRNVTISMDDGTLAKVRIEAARAGMSVSRWIAAELARSLRQRDDKAAASARIDSLLEDFGGVALSDRGRITIDRDEMYADRGGRHEGRS